MMWDCMTSKLSAVLDARIRSPANPEHQSFAGLRRTCVVKSHVTNSGINPMVHLQRNAGIRDRLDTRSPKDSQRAHDAMLVGKNINILVNLLMSSRHGLENALEESASLRSEAIRHSLECTTTSWEKRNVESALIQVQQKYKALAAHQDHMGRALECARVEAEESEHMRLIAISSLKSRHKMAMNQLLVERAELVALLHEKERELGEVKSRLHLYAQTGDHCSR